MKLLLSVHQGFPVSLNLQVSKLKAVTERSSVDDTGGVYIHLISLQLACENISVFPSIFARFIINH